MKVLAGRYPANITFNAPEGFERFAARVIYTASCKSPTLNLAVFGSAGLLILFITVVIDILSVSRTGETLDLLLVSVKSYLNDLAPESSDDSLIVEHIS